MTGAAYAILLLPLASFALNGLWLGRRSARLSAWTATAIMGITAALAVALAFGYARAFLSGAGTGSATAWEHTWMAFGEGLAARFGFLMDPISIMMVAVVAVISFLVNLYSIGYMHDDPGAGRFFPTLALFSFAMLGLVVSTNLVQTFFFWELVGVASYLLIGFWYTRPSAVAASKKAFIMTRFADAFFLMGVLVTGLSAGTFDFGVLNGAAAAESLDRGFSLGLFTVNLLTLSTVLLYAGAWGKSAMFPLHGWLPDAMEGPTPVSSLIHSATMVVAGVYLTARLFPLFAAAEGTLALVEITGAFTALFAAVIACTQTDLKRILAFSTLSQLGLMLAALGAGADLAGDAGSGSAQGAGLLAYSASMFHVFTHAFFKCLLFLSAGVVIHAIHSNDIRDAGGLRRILPLTYWATLVAVLALAGVPPFSGFFSKEEILMAAWLNGHRVAFFATLATGGLTAFYMTRYFLLTFHGRRAASGGGTDSARHGHHPHESLVMVLPILILAVPSLAIGWLARPLFLEKVLPVAQALLPAATVHSAPAWLPWVATSLAAAGLGAGWLLYGRPGRRVGFPEEATPAWYRLIQRKFYVDELYVVLAKGVGSRWVAGPSNWFERWIVNGSFDALAWILKRFAGLVVRLQSGQVQFYMALALVGFYFLYRYARGFQG
jgi:NADH-quinone oxidoreductase subunit L